MGTRAWETFCASGQRGDKAAPDGGGETRGDQEAGGEGHRAQAGCPSCRRFHPGGLSRAASPRARGPIRVGSRESGGRGLALLLPQGCARRARGSGRRRWGARRPLGEPGLAGQAGGPHAYPLLDAVQERTTSPQSPRGLAWSGEQVTERGRRPAQTPRRSRAHCRGAPSASSAGLRIAALDAPVTARLAPPGSDLDSRRPAARRGVRPLLGGRASPRRLPGPARCCPPGAVARFTGERRKVRAPPPPAPSWPCPWGLPGTLGSAAGGAASSPSSAAPRSPSGGRGVASADQAASSTGVGVTGARCPLAGLFPERPRRRCLPSGSRRLSLAWMQVTR